MNNEITNNETDLLCYRLRTKRQKVRAQHEGFEKKLRALDREQSQLWGEKYSLGWVDLNPPVIRGWKRYFILRDDVARCKDAGFFQGILDKINTVEYSSRRDFKRKKREKGKKIYIVRTQELNSLDTRSIKKLQVTAKELEYFEERDILDWIGKKFYKAFVFTEPWRFVLKVKPNIITQTRVRDEVIESRLSEIDNRFEKYNLWPKILKLKNGNTYKNWKAYENEKAKYSFRKKTLTEILNALRDE